MRHKINKSIISMMVIILFWVASSCKVCECPAYSYNNVVPYFSTAQEMKVKNSHTLPKKTEVNTIAIDLNKNPKTYGWEKTQPYIPIAIMQCLGN